MADKKHKVFEAVFSKKGKFYFFADDKRLAIDHAFHLGYEPEFGSVATGSVKFVAWMTSEEFTAFDAPNRR